jgi:hypothetical protein
VLVVYSLGKIIFTLRVQIIFTLKVNMDCAPTATSPVTFQAYNESWDTNNTPPGQQVPTIVLNRSKALNGQLITHVVVNNSADNQAPFKITSNNVEMIINALELYKAHKNDVWKR